MPSAAIRAFWIAVNFLQTYNGAVTAVAAATIAILACFLLYATGRQARTISKGIDLLRMELSFRRRPQVKVRAFKLDLVDLVAKKNNAVSFILRNEGEAPAHIDEIGTAVVTLPTESIGRHEVNFVIEKRSEKLEVGQEQRAVMQGRVDRTAAQAAAQKTDRPNWFCVGYVKYRDPTGTSHQTGFCRKLNYDSMDWDREPDEEYEYSF